MTYRESAGGFGSQLVSYELWDSESGNLIAELDSEVEALAAMQQAARLNGAAALEGLTLLRCDGGISTVVARGSQLTVRFEDRIYAVEIGSVACRRRRGRADATGLFARCA